MADTPDQPPIDETDLREELSNLRRRTSRSRARADRVISDSSVLDKRLRALIEAYRRGDGVLHDGHD